MAGQRGAQGRVDARRYADVASAAGRVRTLREAGHEPVLQEPVGGDLEALMAWSTVAVSSAACSDAPRARGRPPAG